MSSPSSEVETKAARDRFTVLVRSMNSPSSKGSQFVGDSPREAFKAALTAKGPFVEPVMSWNSHDDIAAIDIDYHREGKPTAAELASRIGRVEPSPAYSWITHGGGVRLIYVRHRGYTALEQALLAMIDVSPMFRDATGIEIKHDTRHPCYPRANGRRAGEVQDHVVQDDPSVFIGRLLHTADDVVDEEAVRVWLEENGYAEGERLPHCNCPIEPTDDPKNDCVILLEGGIYCHSCDAKGHTHPKCSRPGFVPWAKLVDAHRSEPRVNHLKAAVRNKTHWAHAKFVVQYHTGLVGKHAELLYKVLLRRWHVDGFGRPLSTAAAKATEDLIGRCFFPAIPLVRGEGAWVHPRDLATPYSERGLAQMVTALPAVQYVDRETGEVKVDKLRAGIFQSNGDLTAYGYAPLDPVRGADVGRLVPASDNEQHRRTVPALLPADPPFRFYDRTARAKFDFREHIARRFPGVNIELLKLLIAGKGYAQRSASEPPRVLITGQSGGGKSAHVLLAAVLVGDTVGKVAIDQDPDRFLRGYATEARRNGFVFSDEVAKSKLTATDLCARLLLVSREATFHQLYVGSTKVGRLAVHVMADTLVPKPMRDEVQLARRIIHVDLGAGVNAKSSDWRVLGDINDWLTADVEAATNREASHMLVSEVMDEVRLDAGGLSITFEDYAERLGFHLLRDAVDGADGDEPFRELFKQVLAAPECTKGKWKGPGWKVFSLSDNTPLARAFKACQEGGDGDFQAITGRQWGGVMNIPGLVCDVSPHRQQVGLRFRVGDPRSADVRYNAAVMAAGRVPGGVHKQDEFPEGFTSPKEVASTSTNLILSRKPTHKEGAGGSAA
jgi:hypothetical protein